MGNLCCRGVMDDQDGAPANSPMYEAKRSAVLEEPPARPRDEGYGSASIGGQRAQEPDEHKAPPQRSSATPAC